MTGQEYRSLTQRFWAKVHKTDECWEWLGGTSQWPTPSEGYGRFWVKNRTVPAHRFAYEALVGPIPQGLQLDHLCRNKTCVNPDHLEPVTHRENAVRAIGGTITHCRYGHPYAGDNLRIDSDGRRRCKACKRAADLRRRTLKNV